MAFNSSIPVEWNALAKELITQLFPFCLYRITGAFSHFNSGYIFISDDLQEPIGMCTNLFFPANLHSSLNLQPNCLSTSSSVKVISFDFPSNNPIHCLPLSFVGQYLTLATFCVSNLSLTRYPLASWGTTLPLLHLLQSSTNISPNSFRIKPSSSATTVPSLVIPCQMSCLFVPSIPSWLVTFFATLYLTLTISFPSSWK